ncbi:MAG: Membrane alanine aminopeptidase [Myxococcales bacterium]|nr:Membrane alanine aminopeptidase [Myxococcales bacterium]
MTRIRSLALVLLAATAAACSSPSVAAPPPAAAEAPPTLRLPSDTRPTAYQLELEIDPSQARFSGRAVIRVQLDRARRELWLHGKSLHVTKASVRAGDSPPVTATWQELPPDGFARLSLPQPIGPGTATIEIVYDAPFNDRLVGLYKAPEAGIDYAFTQFEAIDARWAFPCFDEPVFKTPFDVTLTVPAADVAVSNTRVVGETRDADGKKRVRFATTRPLPTYLVAFAVGPFDVVAHAPLPPNEVRKRPLPFGGVAPRGRGKELEVALDAAAGLLVEEERYFGIEYPYDKLDHIAVPDFAYGAMENAGAITYREEDLLYTEGKSPFTQRRRMFDTIAHEMAHQWFGDLVTLRWWTDAWLNESFATWMAARSVDAWSPKESQRIEVQQRANGVMSLDALAAARAIRQPVNATGDIWNQFDGLTYQKGAAVLGMFERWMGEDKFQRGVSDYLRAHAFGGGSTEDLLRSYSTAAGRDVAAPFTTFIGQPGVALVEATLRCEGDKPSLALRQSRYLPLGSTAPHGERWQIPVCARAGAGGTTHESCTLLDGETGTLPLEGGCPEWVMPNAGGAGYYRWSLPAKELAALAQHWNQLTARERLSFAHNVRAAMASGALPAADGLRALSSAARDSDARVAAQPSGALMEAMHWLVDDAQRPAVAAYYVKLYRPVVARLGWVPRRDDDSATRELREQLLDTMALYVRDPAVRSQALARGRALFDVRSGTWHLRAIDADLRATALAVLVQEQGARAFEALVAALDKATDASLRGQILRALYQVTDPALFDRALGLMLSEHVRRGERIQAAFYATDLWVNEPRLLGWMPAHVDALAAGMPETSAAALPFLFRGLADPAAAAAVRAVFEPRVDKIGSLKRNLAQVAESINLHAAYVAKQRPSAATFFAAPKSERGAATP